MRLDSGQRRLLKDGLKEVALFRRRAALGFILITLAMMILAGRFAYLQLIVGDELAARSDANRVKLRAIAPSRGLIFDRNGVLLADNQPAYRLTLTPELVDDVAATVNELAPLVGLSDEQIDDFLAVAQASAGFHALPLKLRMSGEQVAAFAVNRHRFPGVEMEPYLTRLYPEGEAMSHVIGYVGRLDRRDLDAMDATAAANYAATSHIGKAGLERYYEQALHGKVGVQQIEVNARGRVLNIQERSAPENGQDLHLSIDIDLQRAAVDIMAEQWGAIVAVNPRNGELLALASVPGFNANMFVNGISHEDYRALIDAPGRPLFNRAIQGGYAPGSTIKPYVALAGLNQGLRTPHQQVFSDGGYQLPGQPRVYRDYKRGGHGWVDARKALAESVNVYFYELAVDMGIQRLHDYLQQFGFGASTGIDLHGETSGILPSPGWKRERFNEPWYPGETVIAGIGQGFMVVSPLQQAVALAQLAAGGRPIQPHLRLGHPATNGGDGVDAPSEHWQAIFAGMVDVISAPNGTAYALNDPARPYQIAGKSGTAQVFGRVEGEEYDAEALPRHLRHHALFIAFAPASNPEIAVSVVVEHGGGGSSVAAPVAVQIVDHYLGFVPTSEASDDRVAQSPP